VESIVAPLSRAGFPVSRCLYRSASAQQKSLKREDRDRNSRSAYHLRPGVAAPDLAVVIDDVFTTWATVEACARILKSSGSRSVHALVLAAD
jgi:predicted amidophosphoribosyltransferase